MTYFKTNPRGLDVWRALDLLWRTEFPDVPPPFPVPPSQRPPAFDPDFMADMYGDHKPDADGHCACGHTEDK